MSAPEDLRVSAPSHDLFLKYLSTGQFECARMVFMQAEEDAAVKDKLVEQARWVAWGLRPSEWAFTPSAPSAAHLAWLCGTLLRGQDVPREGGTFSLALASVLQELGYVFDEPQTGHPSERDRKYIDILVKDMDRFVSLVVKAPLELGLVLLASAEPLLAERPELFWTLLDRAVDEVLKNDRLLDAIRYFAIVRETQAPRALIERFEQGVGEKESFSATLLILAESRDATVFKAKMDSLYSACGAAASDLENLLVRAIRMGTVEDFVHRCLNEPFSISDAPRVLYAFDLLANTSAADWGDRLLSTQRSVKRLDVRENVEESYDESTKNDIGKRVLARIDRLGFLLIVAETLLGWPKDLSAARVSHELRSTYLPALIAHRMPRFDVRNLERLAEDLFPGEYATDVEVDELDAISLVVFVAKLRAAKEDEERCGQLASGFMRRFQASPERLRQGAIYVLRRCIRVVGNAISATAMAQAVKEFVASDTFLTQLCEEVLARLSIAELVQNGDITSALSSHPDDLAIQCLNKREFAAVQRLGSAINANFIREASIGIAMEDGIEDESMDKRTRVEIRLLKGLSIEDELLSDTDLASAVEHIHLWRSIKGEERTISYAEEPLEALLDDLILPRPSDFVSSATLTEFINQTKPGLMPSVKNYLSTVCELSEQLVVSPECVVTEGLFNLLSETFVATAKRDLAFQFCQSRSLDARRVLVGLILRESSSSERHAALCEVLDDYEAKQPIAQNSARPVLGVLMGFSSPSRSGESTLDKLLDKQTINRYRGESDFSLESNEAMDEEDQITVANSTIENETWIESSIESLNKSVLITFRNGNASIEDLVETLESRTSTPSLVTVLHVSAATLGLKIQLRESGAPMADVLGVSPDYDYFDVNLCLRTVRLLHSETEQIHVARCLLSAIDKLEKGLQELYKETRAELNSFIA